MLWIEFKGISIHLGLFYALSLENHFQLTFIYTFLCYCFWIDFVQILVYQMFQLNINIFHIIEWFQESQPNINKFQTDRFDP